MNTKQYRQYLYTSHTHPQSNVHPFPQRESTAMLYWSVLPFLVLEYVTELKFHAIPGGVVFPAGFLLFWAFYYTFEEPGTLENRLSKRQKWDMMAIPSVLLSACIWFVKVCVVELVETLISKSFTARKPPTQHGKTIPFPSRPTPSPNHANLKPLPPEIQSSLSVLGLPSCRSWNAIHRRYRELAKAFHPDLNPELTNSGRRFMIYDAAYRKLSAVKNLYFS